MYFMSVWLHITCKVNQNDYLLIHFDEKRRGRDTVQYMDKIAQERRGKKNEAGGKKGE